MSESDYTVTLQASEQWHHVSFPVTVEVAGTQLVFILLASDLASQTMTPHYPPAPSAWAGVDGEPTPSGPALGVQR